MGKVLKRCVGTGMALAMTAFRGVGWLFRWAITHRTGHVSGIATAIFNRVDGWLSEQQHLYWRIANDRAPLLVPNPALRAVLRVTHSFR